MILFKKIILVTFSQMLSVAFYSAETSVNLSVLKGYNNVSVQNEKFSEINFIPYDELDFKPYYIEIASYDLDFKPYYNYFKKNSHKTKQHFNWKNDNEFIVKSIEKLKLPSELSVLPILISGGDYNFVSAFGGIGIWGLHYPVAIKHGLILNKSTDERFLDSAASIAAAKQLKHLYLKYNDINYVVLAYLTSPTLLNRAIKRANNSSLDSVLAELGTDYADWLKAFHALAYINTLVDSEDIFNAKAKEETITHQLFLNKPLLFEAINDKIEFNFDLFNDLNPQNRKTELPNNYPLKLDSVNYFNLTNNLDSIYYYQDSVLLNPLYREAKHLKEMLIYEVRSGDYLGKIAKLYAVTVAEIQTWNELSSSRIDIGQELIIYSPENDTINYLFYKVKKGDTLNSIAAKYPGISADSIKAKNPNKPITPGQLLKIKKK